MSYTGATSVGEESSVRASLRFRGGLGAGGVLEADGIELFCETASTVALVPGAGRIPALDLRFTGARTFLADHLTLGPTGTIASYYAIRGEVRRGKRAVDGKLFLFNQSTILPGATEPAECTSGRTQTWSARADGSLAKRA